MIESERSFLVRALPDVSRAEKKDIAQHYLSEGPDPIRIRHAASPTLTYRELTKKVTIDENDPSRKDEINIPLTPDEYARLLSLALRGLEKTRYLLPLDGGYVAEADVFHGPLEGFVKVEVEFADEAARAAFVPPAWFGREVTQEGWAKNSSLAGKSFADIVSHLE